MLLGEDQILNGFRDPILKHFEGKNYKTKLTDIQGGQNLCVEYSSYTSQGRLIIKLTIKFYSRLKKVMVQGTTESLCEWIDIYEKELAGSLKSTKQESQVPLHSDNYEISMLSEEVQNQALSTPSKQSNTSVPSNMDTPLSHQSPWVNPVISDMKVMFSKVEEDVIIFKKDIDGFLKEISSKLDKLDDLDRLQTKVLSIENTIKVNREQLSNRILELETENEGLKKQIKSQCSRTDDILKRVRKLESRITEN